MTRNFEGHQSDIIVLDFAKAFDKVNHSLLVMKLDHYGIRGDLRNSLFGILVYINDFVAKVKPNTKLLADDTILDRLTIFTP